MRLAGRIGATRESATMNVARRARALRAGGASVVDLGAGEPAFPSPEAAVAAARQALADGFTRYTDLDGVPSLRTAVAERYRDRGAPWTGNGDTLITVGAKAALFELALALFEPGDEVVIPSPCWVSLPQQVVLAGARPVLVETSFARRFAIEAGPILEALTQHTRAVILNSPCNPTGGLVGADDLRAIVAGCAERGLLVISDETYERFVYDGARHASVADLAAEFPDTVVLVGSFSKTYAMTGWRLGYALGPPALIAAARSVQSHATSNPTSFAQPGAVAALALDAGEVDSRVALCERHRDRVVLALNALPGVRCSSPGGAFYAFPQVEGRFTAKLPNATALAEDLLERVGVAVVPGAAFGDDRHLRLSFAADSAVIDEGLDRIARAWS